MTPLSIPTPCHENWDKMNPNEQGRYCEACAKTVIDFTTMDDEEIKYFFLNKKEEKVCGRLRNEQLFRIRIDLPSNIFHLQMPWWKRFLVASLLAFGSTLFSCDSSIQKDVNTEKYVTQGLMMMPIKMPPVAGNIVGQRDLIDASDTASCTITNGEVEILDTLEAPTAKFMTETFSTDTIANTRVELILKEDTIFVQPNSIILKPDSLLLNSPKQDSIKCDSIPIIYT